MNLWQPTIETDGGPWATHNMPCPVCLNKKAIIYLNDGSFHPCGECQMKGWVLKKEILWKKKITSTLKKAIQPLSFS